MLSDLAQNVTVRNALVRKKNGEAHCDHPINSGVLFVTRGAIASHCTAHNAWWSLPTDACEKS